MSDYGVRGGLIGPPANADHSTTNEEEKIGKIQGLVRKTVVLFVMRYCLKLHANQQ
jgi:hypothetical protein